MHLSLFTLHLCAAALLKSVSAISIAEINGNKFLSPYRNQNVTNVSGVVTALGPGGIWIRSTQPDNDPRTSESIYVYGSLQSNGTIAKGDLITLDGRITEYRSSSTYLYLTELVNPQNVRLVSRGQKVEPIVLGRNADTRPPTKQYTSLDNGDVFGLPGNSSRISATNPVLEPTKYGLDFWESLSGELVTVRRPTAVAKPNSFGDTWVRGDWKVSSENSRGGLTLVPGDGNPEAILIGDPLDGTDNPADTKLGDGLNDITGVVSQAFGTYRILPLTKITVTDSRKPALPDPVKYKSSGRCNRLTVGSYNVENLAPNSTHLPAVAEHIVKYLNTPDLMFLQEIQDNNGPTNDNVVSANVTLETLVGAIDDLTSVRYNYVDVDPVDDKDGGQPGGNIRVAYLYNPDVLRLKPSGPTGSSTDAVQVLPGPTLNFNPGRIEPASPAWQASRKPLVAEWVTVRDNRTLFTVNVHFTSKGGSSPIEGDPRPPINGGVDQRIAQANITASFIKNILTLDPQASVITAGDFNEFAFVKPLQTFRDVSGTVDMDEAAGITETERYTYLFDMNSQELDHMFVSPRIARRSPRFEHVHVNTWVTAAEQISDHDPSVAELNVC